MHAIIRKVIPSGLRIKFGASYYRLVHYPLVRPAVGLIFDIFFRRYRTDGCEFIIPKELTRLGYRACFLLEDYEGEERDLIRRFIKPSDAVLEFGACLGIVSCTTNKLLAPNSLHVVLEANPLLIAPLERNRMLNECDFIIDYGAAGVWKTTRFYLHPEYIVGGSAVRKTTWGVTVPGRSIREMTDRYGQFTFLIVDIEGAELDLLRNSHDELGDFNTIVIEMHDFAVGSDGVEACRSCLRTAGFRCAAKAGATEAWQKV